MRVTHHVEPLISRGLGVTVQQPANAIDENFGAAAGNAVQPCGDEPIDDRRNVEL